MLTDLKESARRFFTSPHHIEPEDEPYSSEDDDETDEDDDETDDDEDYFNLDELGIDEEEFYELCPNWCSLKP